MGSRFVEVLAKKTAYNLTIDVEYKTEFVYFIINFMYEGNKNENYY